MEHFLLLVMLMREAGIAGAQAERRAFYAEVTRWTSMQASGFYIGFMPVDADILLDGRAFIMMSFISPTAWQRARKMMPSPFGSPQCRLTREGRHWPPFTAAALDAC